MSRYSGMSLLAESPGAIPGEAPSAPDVPRPRLMDYPHIARCPRCQNYLVEAPGSVPAWTVISATLAFHDSGHRHDPLDDANPRFSWI